MALDFLFLLVDFFLSAADLRDLATLAFLALDFPLADLAAGAFAGFLASFLPLPLVAAAFLPLYLLTLVLVLGFGSCDLLCANSLLRVLGLLTLLVTLRLGSSLTLSSLSLTSLLFLLG